MTKSHGRWKWILYCCLDADAAAKIKWNEVWRGGLLVRLTLGSILHAPPVHKDKGSTRLTVPAVLLNPSHCTLAPTGTHVNALCNLPEPSNRKLRNVKATSRHHCTHKTPSFTSAHLTLWGAVSWFWSGCLKHKAYNEAKGRVNVRTLYWICRLCVCSNLKWPWRQKTFVSRQQYEGASQDTAT